MISAFISAFLLLGQHQHRPGHSFDDVDRWVAEFESPERNRLQKPDEVVAAMKLGARIALPTSGRERATSPEGLPRAASAGTVFAVDLEPNMLRYIAKRARTEGQKNIVPVLALPDSPRLS